MFVRFASRTSSFDGHLNRQTVSGRCVIKKIIYDFQSILSTIAGDRMQKNSPRVIKNIIAQRIVLATTQNWGIAVDAMRHKNPMMTRSITRQNSSSQSKLTASPARSIPPSTSSCLVQLSHSTAGSGLNMSGLDKDNKGRKKPDH